MSDTPWKKKLIEVALPLDAINAESAREKSIRHGHPSTLHLWWARRPLAACRAVLFAQLVDDPSAHPEAFPSEADQARERERLFRIIEDLVKWENSNNQAILDAARAEIIRSCNGSPPPILDPFAGGGSIPLEAQRLGLEAHASDLNPVAVLINKALIEIPPRWEGQPPVHPEAGNRTRWSAAEGLAEDIRRYADWMRDEAERRIGGNYPRANLPDGSTVNVIAWIWTRTATCPNPACEATMPLASSLWLSKKRGQEAWINAVPDGKSVRFEIGTSPQGPPDPPKRGRGARFACVLCGDVADEHHVRAEAQGGRMGSQLMAVVAEGNRRRHYIAPSEMHWDAAQVERPAEVPDLELSRHPQYMAAPRYGMTHLADLFTNRQNHALVTFSRLIGEASNTCREDAHRAGMTELDAVQYATDLSTYLAFALSKLSDRHSMLTNWYYSRESTSSTFQRQAVPVMWDFAETNPLLQGTGTYANAASWVAEVVAGLPAHGSAFVAQADARVAPKVGVVCTDPPYYDNVPFSDLSDYVYGWLRTSLRDSYPDLLGTMAAPKADELVADAQRYGGRAAADRNFEEGFVDVFSSIRLSKWGEFPLTVFYAFKQAESGDDTTTSTAWSTILDALLRAGLAVTATWPVRTEASNRMRAVDSNVLASSVVLACRPRPAAAGVTDRRGLIRALSEELPGPLRELQKAHIAPVDLRQAAIGPGMAIVSRFAKVIEPDGTSMSVRTALGLINQALGTVLDEQEADFDSETRWAIQWFSQFYGDEGPYGIAEQLAVSMNVAVSSMVESGILTSGGGRVRLIGREELSDRWDPTRDAKTSVWEATQHLVKRLETDGESAAGRLLRRLGGLGDSAQLLAYRLYTVCENSRPALAGPYNALVASWPEIQRYGREADQPPTVIEQQSFDA